MAQQNADLADQIQADGLRVRSVVGDEDLGAGGLAYGLSDSGREQVGDEGTIKAADGITDQVRSRDSCADFVPDGRAYRRRRAGPDRSGSAL